MLQAALYTITAFLATLLICSLLRRFWHCTHGEVIVYSTLMSELFKKVGYIYLGSNGGKTIAVLVAAPSLIFLLTGQNVVRLIALFSRRSAVRTPMWLLTLFICLLLGYTGLNNHSG